VHTLVGGKSQMISCDTTAGGPTAMSSKTCRDCGNVLEQEARGCPRCALNFEAENMIDRFVRRRLVPILLLFVLAIGVFAYWLVALNR
jgi:hypothetical protein